MFVVKDENNIDCEAEVNFKKNINFPKFRALRLVALVSLGANALLLLCLWILEARVSKLERHHVDSSPLEIKFGSK